MEMGLINDTCQEVRESCKQSQPGCVCKEGAHRAPAGGLWRLHLATTGSGSSLLTDAAAFLPACPSPSLTAQCTDQENCVQCAGSPDMCIECMGEHFPDPATGKCIPVSAAQRYRTSCAALADLTACSVMRLAASECG